MAYGLISGQSMILPTLTNPAQPNQLLTGTQLINQDKELVVGTMPNRGTVTQTLTQQGQQYTIPRGYHSGSGKITANFNNLIAENVKSGVNIGGVVGTYNGEVGLELVDTEIIAAGSARGSSTSSSDLTLALLNVPNTTDIIIWDPMSFIFSMNNETLSYNSTSFGAGYNNSIDNSRTFGNIGFSSINFSSFTGRISTGLYHINSVISVHVDISRSSGTRLTIPQVQYSQMKFYYYSII